MQTQYFCFVLVVASLVAVNGVPSPSRSERATSISCSAQQFTKLDPSTGNPGCGIPFMGLFNSSAVTSCGTILSLLPIIKNYIINRAQDANNVLTFADQVTQNAFGDFICYVECIMRASKYINPDNSLKYLQMQTEFVNSVPVTNPTMRTVVFNATQKCQLKTAAPSPTKITSASGVVCLLQPTLYFQCIREKILLNYLPRKVSTTCTPLFANLAACDPFV